MYHALETSYRGQTGIGKKMIELLDFYEDVAVLVPTQLSIMEGTFSPEMMSPKVNAKTKLVLKKDSTAILGPYTYHQIKVANLLKKILDNDNTDDQEKARLCSSRCLAQRHSAGSHASTSATIKRSLVLRRVRQQWMKQNSLRLRRRRGTSASGSRRCLIALFIS